MPTLSDIDDHAKLYAIARQKLAALVGDLNEALEELKRNRMLPIKRALARAAEHEAQLRSMIEASPELFEKPRSLVIHGIKVGYQKARGGIMWDDTDMVVRRIKRFFPETAETLLRVKETPVKEALSQLSVQDLRRLGCEVKDAGDEIIVRAVDSAVDKLVDALLRNALSEAEADAA